MLRRKRRDMGGIPTSSMSDVAFLLLVFFLSTTKFDVKKGLGINLPAASTGEATKVKLDPKNVTKVWIDAEGMITLKTFEGEEQIKINQLEGKIKKIVSGNPDMVVSLKTDRKSKYQNMVQALDKLQAAGAEKISLSTN
jgi:biopolymer transport protein ExbD